MEELATETKSKVIALKEYSVPLTAAGKAQLADRLAELDSKAKEVEKEKKKASDEFKEQINDLEERKSKILETIRMGAEVHKSECAFHFDEVTDEVVWTDVTTGNEVERREMTQEERQLTLDELMARNARMAKVAARTAEEVEHDDIQDVIKTETSAKTKLSAVDGTRGDESQELTETTSVTEEAE